MSPITRYTLIFDNDALALPKEDGEPPPALPLVLVFVIVSFPFEYVTVGVTVGIEKFVLSVTLLKWYPPVPEPLKLHAQTIKLSLVKFWYPGMLETSNDVPVPK